MRRKVRQLLMSVLLLVLATIPFGYGVMGQTPERDQIQQLNVLPCIGPVDQIALMATSLPIEQALDTQKTFDYKVGNLTKPVLDRRPVAHPGFG